MRLMTVLAVSGALFAGGVVAEAAVAAPSGDVASAAAKKGKKKKKKKKKKQQGYQLAGKYLSRVQPNPSTETTTTEVWNFCAGGVFKHVTSITDNFGAFQITTERGTWSQLAPNPNGFSIGFSYASRVRQESDGSTQNLLATGPPVRAVTFVGGIFYLDSDAFAVGTGASCL